MIKILIVDDHALVRLGIRRLLEDIPDILSVEEAESGDIALSVVKLNPPDIVLLDMKMPGLDGWEVARRLQKTNPKIRIIALSAMSNDALPERMFALGVMGFLSKESKTEEMIQAIHKVMKGERYLSAEIAQKIAMNRYNESSGQESPFDKLSKREMQVLFMMAKGKTVIDISNYLCLSAKTVNGHRYRMFEKLKVKNDIELIYLAIKYRVVEQPCDVL